MSNISKKVIEPYGKVIIGDSRKMGLIEDESIDFIVTSPPYWHIKDYGVEGQIGYGQTLHEYLKDLYTVWSECYRVLRPGRRMCINVGDQFARSVIYGRYKIIPIHAEIISQCEDIGFDYMGSIIWQKKDDDEYNRWSKRYGVISISSKWNDRNRLRVYTHI